MIRRFLDPNSPRLNATRARQGAWGADVMVVLAISIVLAALAMLAAWAFRFNDLRAVEANNNAQPVEAQVFNTPAPDSVIRQTPAIPQG